MAASIEYGTLIELEFLNLITPFATSPALSSSVDQSQILYRIIITISACFTVAALSGILSFQLKTARKDLKIAQEHLKRVEKMAAVDEMVSGIAHEIKNPLASLSGSIQMLRDEMGPDCEHDRLMQIILRETLRLKKIVTDIRLISKPGRVNAEFIDLTAVEEIATLFQNTPDWNERISITARLEKDMHVFMDPVHLKQILWNLIKNAAESITEKARLPFR